MKIALVQAPACTPDDLTPLGQYAREAGEAGCSVICFPECFLTGYAPEQAAARAIRRDSDACRQVSETAQAYGIDILAGWMERSEKGFHITHGLFRRDGTRDCCRKTHLGSREQQFFTPGEELKVLSLTDGTKIGLQLCVETHYPRITQTLALKGALMVFAPHAVPRVSGDRETIWGKYIPARGYDNRVYMACCNLRDARYGGGCLVTDPRGEVTAACYEEGPALLICQVDPALAASFRDPATTRSRHFYPALGREELYRVSP